MATKYTRDWYLERRNPAPKDEIAAWAVKYALPNYFLFTTGGKEKAGKCTACKSEYSIKAVKNRYVECPNCGQRIKAVEDLPGWGSMSDCFVSYLDGYDEYFLHRIFRVGRMLKNGVETVQIEEAQMQVLMLPLKKNRWGGQYFSKETSYYNDNVFTRYGDMDGAVIRHEYWQRGVLGGFGYNIYQAEKYVYPTNLKALLNGTRFSYSSLWDLAEKGVPFNLYKALLSYERCPQIEYVIKLKMYRLAKGLIEGRVCVNWEENNIKKFLGLQTQEQLDYVIRNDLTPNEFAIYRQRLSRNLPDTEASKKLCSLSNWYGPSFLDKLLKVMSGDAFYEYFLEQQKIKKQSFRNFCMDYRDHLICLEKLGADVHNTMYSKPKDFYALHKRLSDELKAQEKQVFDAQITAVYNAMHELCEWGDDKHLVIMPATAREIVQEGIDQAHCVGNYTERVARSESVILFVRRKDKPNEAWYTMEIKPDMKKLNIVQCRGYENKDRSPEDAEEISKVKRKYQAWFNRRPTNGFEGQILTKYYKAVRKVKGKYISNHDGKTEYKLGEVLSMKTDQNPDNVAVEGIHVASLGFAQNFGNYWPDVAILELEVNIHDVVVPNALDQVRASKVRVLREVPFSEMGVWGETHARKASA